MFRDSYVLCIYVTNILCTFHTYSCTGMSKKQLYGFFKWQMNEISQEKTWTRLRMGNLKRETESLQIAAWNNASRSNYIKARIDKTQRNRCGLCGDRDETINDIIRSQCSKIELIEYRSQHTWAGKGIYWELWKKFKFDHANK